MLQHEITYTQLTCGYVHNRMPIWFYEYEPSTLTVSHITGSLLNHIE